MHASMRLTAVPNAAIPPKVLRAMRLAGLGGKTTTRAVVCPRDIGPVVAGEEGIFGHTSIFRLSLQGWAVLLNAIIDVKRILAAVVGRTSLETGNPLVAGYPWRPSSHCDGFAS